MAQRYQLILRYWGLLRKCTELIAIIVFSYGAVSHEGRFGC